MSDVQDDVGTVEETSSTEPTAESTNQEPTEGKRTDAWKDQLPADLRENELIQGYQGKLGDFAKEYVDLKANSPQSPASIEDYNFGDPPEGAEVNTELEDAYKEASLNLGLSNEQAKGVLEWFAEQGDMRKSATAEEMKTKNATLKDEFKGSLQTAEKALKTFGSPDLAKKVMENPAQYEDILRFAVGAGKAISEDKYVPSESPESTPSYDPFPDMKDWRKKHG